jgi:alkanesulfonate monooxygenase SsuD/methylene tetrahydromethanopterin reductase-like flavin-dependent oxidoreductase (luciferase family)
VSDVPLFRLYEDRLQQMEALDEAGFFAYHLAEHHTPAVHSMAPSQNVFLSAAAQRTRRLRFGPGVYVLPLHHPLRLIEEVSMLDHLSNGRLEIGVGRGGVLEAFFWGQEGDDASNRLRYDETLASLRNGLANDDLNFNGHFYKFDNVPMRLRPLQRPTPSFWYMRNPEVAAEHGMNCIVVGSLDTLEANVVRYRKLWKQHNPGPQTVQGRTPMIGLVVHILLAETKEQAIAEATPAAEAYKWNLGTPRRLEAERRKLTQFVNAEGTGPRPVQPDRHVAPEERRDLDASLAKLAEEERAQRDTRARTGRTARLRGRDARIREAVLRRVHDHRRQLHGAVVSVGQSASRASHAFDQAVPRTPDAALRRQRAVSIFPGRGVLTNRHRRRSAMPIRGHGRLPPANWFSSRFSRT